MADETETIRPLPLTAEYLYGRVMLPGLAGMILSGDQCVHDDTITFKSYAKSRADGVEFAGKLVALGLEIQHLGTDMLTFVKNHDSEKWED